MITNQMKLEALKRILTRIDNGEITGFERTEIEAKISRLENPTPEATRKAEILAELKALDLDMNRSNEAMYNALLELGLPLNLPDQFYERLERKKNLREELNSL